MQDDQNNTKNENIDKENQKYEKLRAYLDKLPIGMPKTKSGVEIRILKHLFTPEEVDIALKLSIIPQPARKIYRYFKKKGYTLEQLEAILNRMVKKGVINGGKGKDGKEMYYSLALLVIGIYEYQVNRLTPEFARNFEQYLKEAFKDEILKHGPPQLRTIPNKESLKNVATEEIESKKVKNISIEQNIDNNKIILPYDDLDQLLDSASDYISVTNCICRQEKELLGEGCDHPKEVCFQFGGAAHYYVENGLGRRITKDEAREIFKMAQEAGLVIQPTNTIRPSAICCCCGCSCGILSNARKLEKPAQYFASNFYSNVDEELCTGCGTCEDRCHMDAIKVKDDNIAHVNLDRCIGCGVCVPSCPSEAIKLVRKAETHLPAKDFLDLYQQIAKNKYS
ncbi:MAG: ATP-binding protein [Promethearchaeota archaeon]